MSEIIECGNCNECFQVTMSEAVKDAISETKEYVDLTCPKCEMVVKYFFE